MSVDSCSRAFLEGVGAGKNPQKNKELGAGSWEQGFLEGARACKCNLFNKNSNNFVHKFYIFKGSYS